MRKKSTLDAVGITLQKYVTVSLLNNLHMYINFIQKSYRCMHMYTKKKRRKNVHSLVVVLLNDDICFAYSYSILMGFLGRTWEIINLFAISFYWCWIFHSLYFHPFCGANICNRDPYVYAQKVPRSFFTQFYVTFIWKSIEIYRHRKGREDSSLKR